MNATGSIRRRLVLTLLAAAAILSAVVYLSVRTLADEAVEQAQDGMLGAATSAIAEELRGGEDGVSVAIPYAAFSMLGAVGEDRVFYRILAAGETVTGYPDLPLPPEPVTELAPRFYDAAYQGDAVRIGAVARRVLIDGRPVDALVLVAQTRSAQDTIGRQIANRAAMLGLGLFALAAVLSVLTARAVLRPIQALAEAVARRGPQDLRAVERGVPEELLPLRSALNGFIGRLRAALARTETFITEAAHHVRTPLATVRAEGEIALRQSDDPATRASLRKMLRAVDASARSAGQLLDHATVVYRSDQRADEEIDLGALVGNLLDSFRPTADMRDIALRLDPPEAPLRLRCDRLLLESALRNLIDNALKYSHPEGEVTVGVARQGAVAVVTVADRGRGIGLGDPARLAARFTRGDNVADVVGSGLGLSIVKDAAAALGGRFALRERDGGGACADFTLPLG